MSDKKTDKAEEMMEELKAMLLETLWGDKQYNYNNQKMVIPWLHEDYSYAIQRLSLSPKQEAFYFDKIERIIGEYAEFYDF